MRRLLTLLVVPLGLLSGCLAGNQALVKPCCYQGDFALVRLAELDFVLRDGSLLPFERAFPGFSPAGGAFALVLPYDEPIRIRRVAFGPLADALPEFDFNRDGQLDDPELLVFYVATAARGFGHDVADVVAAGRVTAVQTSLADIGGVVGYVGANRARLDPHAQTLLRELVHESEIQRRDRQSDRGDDWVRAVPKQ